MRTEYGRVIVRKFSLKFGILLVCFSLLVGCAAPTPVSPLPTATAPVSETPPTVPASPSTDPSTASPAPAISSTTPPSPSSQVATETAPVSASTQVPNTLTHYSLDAVFNYFQHTLAVTEAIRYVNDTTGALDGIVLIVEANRWAGSFAMLSLAWEDGTAVEEFELLTDQLNITLPALLQPGDDLGIEITYTVDLPQIPAPSDTDRPQPFGYTSRQTNIVDWYPYIPPYQPGEGWLVHKHWWFGEHQAYAVADFDVQLTLAEPVQDLVMAASAPARREGDIYDYHLASARTFAASASDQYQLQKTSVGDIDIFSYSFPYDKYSGEQVLHDTAAALELFSQLITPYPRASLSVVEADFLDGMEYDGLFFLSHGFYDLYDGTPKGYLTFIAAHEAAHQWWYGLVGNDQALEPWLDEAMCTYMEHIFYENVYADYPTGSDQSMVDWWWYYRVNFYEPQGTIDRSIYDFNQFRPYRDAIYLNGAKFFEDLRSLVGDEAFFATLRDYARQNKDQIATAEDFFSVLRQNTSKDLDGLLAQYFKTP